jgi:hypothetical protein
MFSNLECLGKTDYDITWMRDYFHQISHISDVSSIIIPTHHMDANANSYWVSLLSHIPIRCIFLQLNFLDSGMWSLVRICYNSFNKKWVLFLMINFTKKYCMLSFWFIYAWKSSFKIVYNQHLLASYQKNYWNSELTNFLFKFKHILAKLKREPTNFPIFISQKYSWSVCWSWIWSK